jgi:hypothetical protein
MGSIAFASPATAAKDCPYGTVPTKFPGVCTQGVGGGGPVAITVPQQGSGGNSAEVAQLPGQLPSVNGIPCNLEHQNYCYAAQQPGSG